MTITYVKNDLYESNRYLVIAAVRAALVQFTDVERVNKFLAEPAVQQGLNTISSCMSERQWFNIVNGAHGGADCMAEIYLVEGDEFAEHIESRLQSTYDVKIAMVGSDMAHVTGKLGNVRKFLAVEYADNVDAPLYIDRVVVNG